MLPQPRPLDRVCIEAAVHGISERRQAIRAGDPCLQFGGAKLGFKLREFRPPGNVLGPELLQAGVNRNAHHEIGGTDRSGEIIAHQYAQRTGGHNFIGQRAFQFIASFESLQLGAREIDGRNFSAAHQ